MSQHLLQTNKQAGRGCYRVAPQLKIYIAKSYREHILQEPFLLCLKAQNHCDKCYHAKCHFILVCVGQKISCEEDESLKGIKTK